MWAFETKKSSEAWKEFFETFSCANIVTVVSHCFPTSEFRYIEVPNDPSIPSGLMRWRENHKLYPDMGKMARDALAVPASGCAVKRQFNISGRITIRQRNRLGPTIILDATIYKGTLARTFGPLRVDSGT